MPSGPVKLFRMCGKKYFGWLSVEAAPGWSFTDLLDKVKSQSHLLCLFDVTAWKLWTRRNKLCMGENSIPIGSVADFARAYNSDYQRMFKLKPRNPRPHDIKWKPPDTDYFKVNFDGAMFDDTNEAGIGVIIRNNHGEVMASLSEKI